MVQIIYERISLLFYYKMIELEILNRLWRMKELENDLLFIKQQKRKNKR